MRLRENIIAAMVHGAILFAITVLVFNSSCSSDKEETTEEDSAEAFFKDIQSGLDDAMAESLVIIAVDDSIGAGADLQRQVYQEIQSRLHDLESVSIMEYPEPDLMKKFELNDITPSDGISPEKIVKLAIELDVDALLYASIESSTPDVYFKVYSGGNGAVIYADTLEQWTLPVKIESEPDQFSAEGEVEAEAEPEAGT